MAGSKYHNRRSDTRDGHSFASKRERDRYEQLSAMEVAGQIRGLKLQVRFPLIVGEVKVGTYVADFEYREDGQRVVEDVKGYRTQLYLMKRRLMKALYGVEILET